MRQQTQTHYEELPDTFTSITVNKNFAARPHRDSGNAGPSFARSLGDYSGGNLLTWIHDAGGDLASVTAQQPTVHNTKFMPKLFDGRQAHAVQPFIGERYSMIAYTVLTYEQIN